MVAVDNREVGQGAPTTTRLRPNLGPKLPPHGLPEAKTWPATSVR